SLVIIFMLIYYRGAGLVADIALTLNVLFVLAGLTAFGATLTLPGIAGIVLTVGMAVDANVLIFERVREELRAGRSVRQAIDAGYEKAFSAILDANVTTGLAAIVLYQFGSGPIRGFAVTLGIGIICSMYTALVATRLIFDRVYGRGAEPKQMSI
ncbi:MAG: SecD/SecF family protein translocase subunit, partial [Bradymonadia bacterium]